MSTPVTYRERLLDRYRLLYNWLPETDAVLDVGCGNGIYTQWLAKKCEKAVGVDHNEKNLRWAKDEFPHCEFVFSNGENLPFKDESFGAVMLTEVLEHTRDDRATLHEIARVTRSGGTLLLSTPHRGLFAGLDPDNTLNSLFAAISRLKIPKPGGGRFYQNFRFDWHRHYSENELRALLGEEWEVEEVAFGGFLLYPLLYGVENALDAFGKKRSYWQDYRVLRQLRGLDFDVSFGRWSYNIALRARRV
ncbi:MAG: class I SAM-dependent methyltransferase [Armatimonadetes bacterium]|nr:class I SAM-dependent methyltransferase [Armatimonadota bacterium]